MWKRSTLERIKYTGNNISFVQWLITFCFICFITFEEVACCCFLTTCCCCCCSCCWWDWGCWICCCDDGGGGCSGGWWWWVVVVAVDVEVDDLTIVLRSAKGGPVNLLTAAGTVCKRICVGFVELLPMVCVTGPEVVAPTRSNWYPFSVFSISAGVCPGVSELNVIYKKK